MTLEPPHYRARTLKDAFRVCNLGALTGVDSEAQRWLYVNPLVRQIRALQELL